MECGRKGSARLYAARRGNDLRQFEPQRNTRRGSGLRHLIRFRSHDVRQGRRCASNRNHFALGRILAISVFCIAASGAAGRTIEDLSRARLPLRMSLAERAAVVGRVSGRMREGTLTLFVLDSVAICEERYAVRPDSSRRRGAVAGDPDTPLRDDAGSASIDQFSVDSIVRRSPVNVLDRAMVLGGRIKTLAGCPLNCSSSLPWKFRCRAKPDALRPDKSGRTPMRPAQQGLPGN